MAREDELLIKAIAEKNSLGEIASLKQFSNGRGNLVYELNGNFVVKIRGKKYPELNMFGSQPELLQIMKAAGMKVPDLYEHATLDDHEYMLLRKIPGHDLSVDWWALEETTKERLIAEIAEQLKIMHSLCSPEYRLPIVSSHGQQNLREATKQAVDFDSIDVTKLPAQYQGTIEFLKQYFEEHSKYLDETDTAVFVHNDLNLENIIWNGERIVGLIDFDWLCYSAKDSELKRIVHYTYTAKDWVDKSVARDDIPYLANQGVKWLKKHYPELFAADYLSERVRCYLMQKILRPPKRYLDGQYDEQRLEDWARQVDTYYRTNWLENLLED